MKILVVDDELISRKKLDVLLNKFGQCSSVESGEQACQKFCQAFELGAPYDLITLDISMPGLSGAETLQRIRTFEERQGVVSRTKRVKILMVTGKSDTSSVMSSYTGGCDGYMTKPFNITDIEKSLTELGLLQNNPS